MDEVTFQPDLMGFNAYWEGFVFFFSPLLIGTGRKKEDRSGEFLKETVFNLVTKNDLQLPGK